MRDCTSEGERRAALADFLNHYNHEQSHTALGGKPLISRTADSDYRVSFDQVPEPLDTIPQQLTIEDLVEPPSCDNTPSTPWRAVIAFDGLQGAGEGMAS